MSDSISEGKYIEKLMRETPCYGKYLKGKCEAERDCNTCPIDFECKIRTGISELDTQNTREIVCPYCGQTKGNSWEEGEEGTLFCGNHQCEKEFKFEREVEVTYSTYKLEEKEND